MSNKTYLILDSEDKVLFTEQKFTTANQAKNYLAERYGDQYQDVFNIVIDDPDFEYHIIDWASNRLFQNETFLTFDDAEEFLTIFLGNAYENCRDTYFIVPNTFSED